MFTRRVCILIKLCIARYIIQGYDKPDFDDSLWNTTLVTSGPSGTLVNQRQNPTRIVGELKPLSVNQPVAGVYVFTFERVVSGWVRVTATGPAKTLITIHFGEKLLDDGTVAFQGISAVKSPGSS